MCRMTKSKTAHARDGRASPRGMRTTRLDSISVNSNSQRNWFLSWLGVAKKKRTDNLIVFDDNSSLDSALLWSHAGDPCPDDYLEFVHEHERSLTNFASTIALPSPPEDRMDY